MKFFCLINFCSCSTRARVLNARAQLEHEILLLGSALFYNNISLHSLIYIYIKFLEKKKETFNSSRIFLVCLIPL